MFLKTAGLCEEDGISQRKLIGIIATCIVVAIVVAAAATGQFRPRAAEACFADPNLETVVKEAVGTGKRPIYPSDMEECSVLYASEGNISDLTGLEHCINLTQPDLSSNQISNISPLLDNTGRGDGDTVERRYNPLSERSIHEYIPALQPRGVTVNC